MQKLTNYFTARGWKADLDETISNLSSGSIDGLSTGCMAIGIELIGLAALEQILMLKYPYERASLDNFKGIYGLKMAMIGGIMKLAADKIATPIYQRQK